MATSFNFSNYNLDYERYLDSRKYIQIISSSFDPSLPSHEEFQKAETTLFFILKELPLKLNHLQAQNLLEQYDKTLSFYMDLYPKLKFIINQFITIIDLPRGFANRIYQANTALKKIQVELKHLGKQLSIDLHPILTVV